MKWEELKYGLIIYGRSSCALTKTNGYQLKKVKNFEQDHFIVLMTDTVFNKEKGTKTDFHLGVVISSTMHDERDIQISSSILPNHIKEYFGTGLKPNSYLVISKPVIIQQSKITEYFDTHVDEFYPAFGAEFCNDLCASRELLKETLFKNMQDYNLPDISTLSSKCSCSDCGCLNPFEAKLMQGEITLSICPNHLNDLQEYVADFDMTKQNIQCYNQMKLMYARMKEGEFLEGENEYTMIQLRDSIEQCKMTIEMEGAYCHEVNINPLS